MKIRLRGLLLLFGLAVLAGCSGAKAPTGQKPDFAKGGRIFDSFCAECHLNADSDAPQLDEDGDWNVRSPQWASIFSDHARSGFLGMPAKGGHAQLSNQDINDALYYMEVKIQAQQ
ncbi:MAG: c-type cytochrome [Candidatus Methylumidiphilus sp.]